MSPSRGATGDRGEKREVVLQTRDLRLADLLDHLINAFPTSIPVENGRLDQPRHGSGCRVADRQGFDHIVAADHIPHTREELGRVDLDLVQIEQPFDDHHHGGASDEDQDPEHHPKPRRSRLRGQGWGGRGIGRDGGEERPGQHGPRLGGAGLADEAKFRADASSWDRRR